MAYNGAGKCNVCGGIHQRYKAPNGALLCADCYKKVWGKYPWE